MKRKKLAKNILPHLILILLLCLLTSCDGKSENTKPADSNSSAAKTGDGSEAGFNLTLATLNIKHGAEGLDKIAEAIKDISPDIIGLEEVDVNCERSGFIDETKVVIIIKIKTFFFWIASCLAMTRSGSQAQSGNQKG